MNRFRSKKRQNDSAGSTRRPSVESEIPPVPTANARSKTFRRNKKVEQQPVPEPRIDIAAVLPPSDDFRTSMLMPGLSARFSMLREQDDPTSKIGKANDDSVLFPKRASRLEMFNRQGLADIAEVDSLRGPIRPPFAFRTGSYSTDGGYGTDDDTNRNGSIMSRAKQGEGNTMFGGRQKIYKIPVDGSGRRASGNSDGGSGPTRGMGGKFLYESDISVSQFQQLRIKEREERERAVQDPPSTRSSKEDERSGSPPSSKYNKNRETTSSTTSGPSQPRNSTAATSVASQRSVYGGQPNANGSNSSMASPSPGPYSDRPVPKNKRLYGQGLDQQMHEQQHSAIHRLESLHRQRAMEQPFSKPLQPSRSVTSLNDRHRNGPLYASNNFRAASPPPSATPPRMGDFDLGLGGDNLRDSFEKNDSGYGRSPPLSPPMSPTEHPVFASALEPNDLGKATASGAFNKPKRQYNEQQYSQRQLQLQQGRETPPPVRPFSPNAPSIDEKSTGRSRNDSVNSTFSTNGSIRQPQNYASNDKHLNSVPESPDRRVPGTSDPHHPPINTSFFSGFSSSEASPQTDTEPDMDSPDTSNPYQSLSEVVIKEPVESEQIDYDNSNYQHSRLSQLPTPALEESVSETLSQRTITQSHRSSISKPNLGHLDADSPTLGPTTTTIGLNGLVRAHLRNDSGQSSIYPEPSPGLQSKFPMENYSSYRGSGLHQSQTFFHQDSTSDDERDIKNSQLPEPDQPDAMPPPLAVAARNFLEQATALKNHESPKAKQMLGNDKAQRILGREAPRSSQESAPAQSWQEQLRAHHARGGSTETEKERDAFASELAERRRAVQDNLKSFVENESRSASPGPGTRNRDPSPAGKPAMPFGILTNKNSKTSMAPKADNPTKAMKMLGIDPGTNIPSRPSVESSIPDESQQRSRYMNDGQRAQLQSRQRSKPPNQRTSPPLSKSSRENRSNSDLSERRLDSGKGRTGDSRSVARDPMPQKQNAPLNFAGGPPRPVEELMASMARHQPSTERSQSADPGRLRSNSRTNPSGYFEPRGPPSAPASVHSQVGFSPRPSPMAATHSAHSTPSLSDHPSNFPNATSPVMINTRNSPTPTRHHPAYRKGSINKHDISEPRFLSCTSSVTTVDLPPEASLRNGMESFPSAPPPLPAFNPRRKRTRTLLEHLGKSEKQGPSPLPSSVQDDPYEERSTFSADEGDPKPKPSRQRLRKTSSEGGSMAAKARQQALMAPSPAMPQRSQNAAPSSSTRQPYQDTSTESSPGTQQHGSEGSAESSPAMRQYPHSPATAQFQTRADAPATGVMF
ncbi:hypothetical protein G7Y79_00010g028590 [Physcia stellaris]|nr:hypothetical protein G7Y79_00010g028590 [Physcia stellaris]